MKRYLILKVLNEKPRKNKYSKKKKFNPRMKNNNILFLLKQ